MNTIARPRYAVIAKEVAGLLAKLPVQSAPVPVDKLAELCGASVVYNDFKDEISGLLFRESGRLIIGVASEQPIVRQRFTIAHELGHALLHQISTVHVDKSFSMMFRSAASSTAQDVYEIEANTFAAELLMPESLLKEDLVTLELDMEDGRQLSMLADRYKVSTQALTYRLLTLCPETDSLFEMFEVLKHLGKGILNIVKAQELSRTSWSTGSSLVLAWRKGPTSLNIHCLCNATTGSEFQHCVAQGVALSSQCPPPIFAVPNCHVAF